jgi:hypothetical protein
MEKKNLTDYYPVYKDVSDLIKHIPSDNNFEYPINRTDSSSEQNVYESELAGSPAILNREELIDLALKFGLSTLQTVILITKNAFEGHVFLKYNVRPDQLFCQGTTLFQAKPEIMILNFFENISQYESGLNQIWQTMQERDPDLVGINFELLVHYLIVNHLIRLPVSLFSSSDIRTYTDQMLMNQQAMKQRFDLVILGEGSVGEFEFIEKVNFIYAEKFKEFADQLRIKEDVILHYQRKLALALFPEINTEEELDELMYKKLVEEKMNSTTHPRLQVSIDDNFITEASNWKMRIREKTKILYRLVSKNCCEVHSSTDSENNFPELTQVFLNANTIYIQPAGNISDAYLQYMRMVLLMSKVVIFRKTHGFNITGDLQSLSSLSWKEVISKDDLRALRKNLDARLAEYRLKSLTDYKMKFIMDDELTDIHNHFLKKQMDYIDKQIIQMQIDIKEILKMKSQVSILKTSKN